MTWFYLLFVVFDFRSTQDREQLTFEQPPSYVHTHALYLLFFVYIMLLTSGQISMGISSFIGT